MISLKNTLKLLVSFFLLMVSASQADTSMTYIHTDHLGSPIAATDEAGQVKWTEEYQPFGVQRTNQDSDNSTGFTGHQYDDELELTYMQARWYHPEVGRFMSLDPVDTLGHIQRGNPIQGFNRYAYANNNPYKYVDPDGEFLNFAFKFVADVAINATLNYLETGSVDLGSAVGDAAVAVVNPAKTLQKAKRIAQIVNKSDKVAKGTRTKKVQPIKDASGSHTTWKNDPQTGGITRHETWKPNAKNPTGWDKVQSTDLKGAPHINKKTGEAIPTPHTQGKNIPGGVRPAKSSEIPKRND